MCIYIYIERERERDIVCLFWGFFCVIFVLLSCRYVGYGCGSFVSHIMSSTSVCVCESVCVHAYT